MNFDRLIAVISGIGIGAALVGELPTLQQSIFRAHAHLLAASRTNTWGSPYFFTDPQPPSDVSLFRNSHPPKFKKKEEHKK